MSENEKNSFRDHDSSFDNTIPNESVNYVLESIGGETAISHLILNILVKFME